MFEEPRIRSTIAISRFHKILICISTSNSSTITHRNQILNVILFNISCINITKVQLSTSSTTAKQANCLLTRGSTTDRNRQDIIQSSRFKTSLSATKLLQSQNSTTKNDSIRSDRFQKSMTIAIINLLKQLTTGNLTNSIIGNHRASLDTIIKSHCITNQFRHYIYLTF